MSDAHLWSNLILRGADEAGAMEIIDAVNAVTVSGRANRGSVIVACAQMMAQTVVLAGPECAKEVRDGIMSLIDDYATKLASETP